jgi:protein-tyrosine phosphatase
MFSFLKKKETVPPTLLTADMHSHLLPGIDDGADTLEKSIELITYLAHLGYNKLITTPHIMGDFYRNTPEIIRQKLAEVQQAVLEKQIPVEIQAAAEYYLDEWLIEKLENSEPLLTFGKNFLLFETAFMSHPPQFNQVVFMLKTQGYQPVLAHPERYAAMQENFAKLERIAANGVLMQVNLNSLTGYYGKKAQTVAEKMIDLQMVHFAGTDTHSLKHISILSEVKETKYYGKLLSLNLLNHLL